MATEPLEYKVSFDTSEVAQKLQEVKNQMDMALGAQAFRNSGPDPYPFQQIFDTPRLAKEAAQNTFNSVFDSVGDMKSFFRETSESARLGYSKFKETLEMDGLLSKINERATRSRQLGFEESRALAKSGEYFGSLNSAVTGSGYDPSMSITQAEFQDVARSNAKNKFMDPSFSNAMWAVGGMAFGGPLGLALGGLELGFEGAKGMAKLLTANKQREDVISSHMQNTSWRFLSGRMNSADTDDVAEYIRKIHIAPENINKSYTASEVDKVISDFTMQGGYDTVRSAEEYKERTKKLFEDHRSVMHILHTTSEEATKLMADLSKSIGVTDFTGFATNMKALGIHSGLGGAEMASFVTQGAELARGSGFSMMAAASGSAALLAEVKDLARGGTITDEMVRQSGGLENMALQATRSALNYGSSPMGMVNNAALAFSMLGGFDDPMGNYMQMGINERLSSAAQLMGSRDSLLRMPALNKRMNEQKGVASLSMEKTLDQLRELSMVTGRSKIDPLMLESYMMYKGYSQNEIDRTMGTFLGDPERFDIRERTLKHEINKSIFEGGLSKFDKVTKKIGRIAGYAYEGLENNIGRPLSDFISDDVGYGAYALYDNTIGALFSADSSIPLMYESGGSGLDITDYSEQSRIQKIKNLYGGNITDSDAAKIVRSAGNSYSYINQDKLGLLKLTSSGPADIFSINNKKKAQAALAGSTNSSIDNAFINSAADKVANISNTSFDEFYSNFDSTGLKRSFARNFHSYPSYYSEEEKISASIGRIYYKANENRREQILNSNLSPEEKSIELEKIDKNLRQFKSTTNIIDRAGIEKSKSDYFGLFGSEKDLYWTEKEDQVLRGIEENYGNLSEVEKQFAGESDNRFLMQALLGKGDSYLSYGNRMSQNAFASGLGRRLIMDSSNSGIISDFEKISGKYGGDISALANSKEMIDFLNREDVKKEFNNQDKYFQYGDQKLQSKYALGIMLRATRGEDFEVTGYMDGKSYTTDIESLIKNNKDLDLTGSYREFDKKFRKGSQNVADTLWDIVDPGFMGIGTTAAEDFTDKIKKKMGYGFEGEDVMEYLAIANMKAQNKAKAKGLEPGTPQYKKFVEEEAKANLYNSALTKEYNVGLADLKGLHESAYNDPTVMEAVYVAGNSLSEQWADTRKGQANLAVKQWENTAEGKRRENETFEQWSSRKQQVFETALKKADSGALSMTDEQITELEQNKINKEYSKIIETYSGVEAQQYKEKYSMTKYDALNNKTTMFDEATAMSEMVVNLKDLVQILAQEHNLKKNEQGDWVDR